MSRLSLLSVTIPHSASGIDAAAFTDICLTSCKRLPAMRRTLEARHLDRLVAAGAWTDAALALIAIELPDWQLRRLIVDEGEWHCALSTERSMPDWLDDAVEAHHADLATAILDAFCSAVDRTGPSHLAAVPTAVASHGDFTPMSCENYC